MERKVLGRGLDALITPSVSTDNREKVQTISVSQIKPSRFQPRQNFDISKIEDLAASIKEKGIIQPILVRALSTDQYELIAGERRLRAIKHLGISEIPAIVRPVPDSDALEIAIIENIQREELNPIEEAKAYARLSAEFGFSQDHIASRVGKNKSSISNLLRLLNLPAKIQNYLSKNMITFGHARALLAFQDQKIQIQYSEEIIKNGLSVRQIEQISQRVSTKRSATKTTSASTNVDIKNLEDKLQHALGTRVKIQHGKKRGRIHIEYYSLTDLDRILKAIGVASF